MGDEHTKYGAYEHTTGASDGIIHRDKSSYTHDRSKYRRSQVKRTYTAPERERTVRAAVSSIPHSPQESSARTVNANTARSEHLHRVITPEKEQDGLRHGESRHKTDTVPNPYQESSAFSFPQSSPLVTADSSANSTSFLTKNYSFQEEADTRHQKGLSVERPQNKRSIKTPKSKYSRYFTVTAKPSDAVTASSVSSRIASAVTPESKAATTSVEEQLKRRGVSVTDVFSPLVNGVRNQDDTGTTILTEGYDIGVKTHSATKTIKNQIQKKKAPVLKKKQVPATQSTLQGTVAAQGGKKAGQVAAKAIPPYVYLIIIAVIALSVILYMLLGIAPMAVGSNMFSMGESTELILTDPDTKNNLDIVAWCKWAEENGHGYVYGAFGQICTMDYLDQQAARYPGEDEAGGAMRVAGEQWIGKPVYDCIGIIKAYMWCDYEEEYITYQSNNFPDCGANSIWDEVEISGTIEDIPEMPGIAVWVDGHIGIYIGNGEVIEAQGTETGVVKTNLENGAWTHWLYVPHLEYREIPTESTTTESE